MPMKYQLVLQFAGAACLDLDELIALEDELTRNVPADAEGDGHDIGSGEANIFIWTPDPVVTFAALAPILQGRHRLAGWAAAYRAERSDEFVRVWPAGSTTPFVVQ
jgi:hypothetical protein